MLLKILSLIILTCWKSTQVRQVWQCIMSIFKCSFTTLKRSSFIQDEMIQLFWLCGLLGEIKYCSQKCSCSSGAGGDWCGVGEWWGLFCSYTQEADQGTCDLSSLRLFSDSPFKMVILFHLCDCKDLRLKKVLVFKTEDLIEYRPDCKLEWFWLMLRNNKCIIISLKNI